MFTLFFIYLYLPLRHFKQILLVPNYSKPEFWKTDKNISKTQINIYFSSFTVAIKIFNWCRFKQFERDQVNCDIKAAMVSCREEYFDLRDLLMIFSVNH